jgi:hypothetical protein
MANSPADKWAAEDLEASKERRRKINIALTGFGDAGQTDGYHGTYDDWVARAYRAEARIEDLERELSALRIRTGGFTDGE